MFFFLEKQNPLPFKISYNSSMSFDQIHQRKRKLFFSCLKLQCILLSMH